MATKLWLGRIWRILKPPPAVPTQKAPMTTSQRTLIRFSTAAVLLFLGAGGAYYWIASAPDRAEAHFQAGMRLMNPGRYPAAILEFSNAVNIWDGHAQAYLQRGNARQIVGQKDAALDDFEKAALMDPSLAEAFTARGTILRDRGDLKGAIAEITRSLNVRATTDGYYQRGQLWARLGEHQRAVADFDRAIDEQRDAPYVYSARADSKRALGDQAGYEQDRDAASQLQNKP
jgi:tetratricopeptide (TPR) repeat protein